MNQKLTPTRGLHLLPPSSLLKTGPVDHADWNYRPLLGWVQRLRFRLILKMLPPGPFDRLLEVGYGSGVFLPELARRTQELHGIDIHPYPDEVAQRLAEFGIAAHLKSGSAESMPYPDHYFDVAVSVSCLEFVPDPVAAAQELRRVLKPEGRLVLVTPGRSLVGDLGLWLLTRNKAKDEYENRRESLLPALQRCFAIEAQRHFPPLSLGLVRLYHALRMRPI